MTHNLEKHENSEDLVLFWENHQKTRLIWILSTFNGLHFQSDESVPCKMNRVLGP